MKAMNKEWRKDWRTDEEFAKDILDGHKAERDIIERYRLILEQQLGRSVTVENNGVDNSGKPLPLKDVNTKADFIVDGKLLEVKFIKRLDSEFRFKVGHLNSYIKQGAPVLLVNGWETQNPVYTIMTPEILQKIKDTRTPQPFYTWGNKLCYFLRMEDFVWDSFKYNKTRQIKVIKRA